MELINNKMVDALKIPSLYGTEDIKVDEKILRLCFKEPNTGWFWYMCEYDSQQKLGFGYVVGFESEWGYFSLEEMEAIYTIERDEEFVPVKFKELEL